VLADVSEHGRPARVTPQQARAIPPHQETELKDRDTCCESRQL
jgi:hypothetical protein